MKGGSTGALRKPRGPPKTRNAIGARKVQRSIRESKLEALHKSLREYAQRKGFSSLEEWYKQHQTSVAQGLPKEYKARKLLAQRGLANVLSGLYADHVWHPWRFLKVPASWWLSPDNQAWYLNEFFQNNNITSIEDLYRVTSAQLVAADGASLLKIHSNSLIKVWKAAFPGHRWEEWRMAQVPKGFWAKPSHLTHYLDSISKDLNVHRMDDWYAVRTQDIETKGGVALVAHYKHNLHKILKEAYPKHPFLWWKFTSVPNASWSDPRRLAEAIRWVGAQLGYKSPEDWYKCTNSTLESIGMQKLSVAHARSPLQLLRTAFPKHKWLPWKFESTTKNYWKDAANVRTFFGWLNAEVLHFSSPNQWYSLTHQRVVDNGGQGMFYEGQSVAEAVQLAYPNHSFLPWKFKVTTQRYWDKPANIRAFLAWVASTAPLQIAALDDWYSLSHATLEQLGVEKVLQHFSNSTARLLAEAYPSHRWIPWRFSMLPRGFWQNAANIRNYLDWIKKELELKGMSDWYAVSPSEITRRRGSTLLAQYNHSLQTILKRAYPSHEWSHAEFAKFGGSEAPIQRLLQKLFNTAIVQRSKPFRTLGGKFIELDYYIEALKKAVEYQGEQHYFDVRTYGLHDQQAGLDETKAALAALSGVSLVEVPYWAQKLDTKKLDLVFKNLHAGE